MSFNKININSIIHKMGFKALKPIQENMLKESEKYNNLILLSPTGSGKTLAFVLPLLKRINPDIEQVQSIILSPTRELALQIEKVIKQAKTGFKVLTCYGGHPFSRERNSLKQAPKIIIATPGRLLDHLKRETFDTSLVKSLVIDEYDKCLELGFSKEMQAILFRLPAVKYTSLTSATVINEIPSYLKLHKVKTIDNLDKTEELNLSYYYTESTWEAKNDTLLRLLKKVQHEPSILFCNFKSDINDLSDFLSENDIVHSVFYGDLEQEEREKALLMFRNGSTHLLLATDLAARGLDIPEIKNIIHYQIPSKEDTFIHRNGRTARMNKHGNVYVQLIEGKSLPDYISSSIQKVDIQAIESSNEPEENLTETIYISAGKMQKIAKVDVLGFLCKEGGLKSENIGLIEIKDRASFVAIENGKASKAIKQCNGQKIKKVKVRVDFA